MLPGFHGIDLIVIFVVVLLVFGPKQLPKLGAAAAKSLREFRKSAHELDTPEGEATQPVLISKANVQDSEKEKVKKADGAT